MGVERTKKVQAVVATTYLCLVSSMIIFPLVFLDTKSYPYWFGTTIVVDIFFFLSFLFLFSFSSFSGCALESTSVVLTSEASSV